MKQLIKISTFFWGIIAFCSCQTKELDQAVIDKDAVVTPNQLMSIEDQYTFTEETRNEDFDTLFWTPVDFGVATAPNYSLQADITADGFSEPINLNHTYNLESTFTKGDLNKFLLEKGIEGGSEVEVSFRVEANIHEDIAPVYSESVSTMITIYAPLELAPLYVMGDDQEWNMSNILALHTLDIGEYEVIGTFNNGSHFRFFEGASWESNQLGYGSFNEVDELLESATDADDNFRFAGESGVYFMTVSLRTKTITMEKASTPELYLVGDQNGWSFDKMTWLGGGKYEVTSNFWNANIFRFFTEDGNWSSKQYNYNFFREGTITGDLSGDTDGDANLRFEGTDGEFKVSVDLYTQSIELK
ncbi:SusE domain-containing protein [Flammeovirga sp. OC4]|uniref:SusE domain-containing protein n=1 Tax=Flammeovirga sp. OC4 TaxID=1382345 RepID=UPI0005C6175F|nr:SusE domain-containing protein [Flammeovirga sp. OC4]